MPDSGESKQQKQTVNSAPWTAQQQPLRNLFGRAEGLYQQGPTPYYPGDTRADLSPTSQQALQGITQRGAAGSPLNAASGAYLQDVLGGKYLNQQSPGWDAVQRKTLDAVNSNYAGRGRYGSGYHDAAVGDSIGALAYQDYANQMARMDMAAGLAPTIAGQDFVDLNAMLGAGDRYQSQLQDEIDADMQRYQYEQEAPYANLQRYQDFIMGNYGGNTQTIAPRASSTSPWQTAAGLGLTAASLYGQYAR
jgi:hypothetical protein